MTKSELHQMIADNTGNESNICQIYAIKNGVPVYDDCWHEYKTTDAVNEINIRIAVPTDEQKIRELFVEMMASIHGTEDPDDYYEIYLKDYWTGQEDRIYVAEDHEVIAFLSVEVHHEPVKYIYLDDFSVTAAYRNQGIGSELLLTAETYAKENRISAVLLHVHKTNESAMRFYERSGYSIYRDDKSRYLLKKDISLE